MSACEAHAIAGFRWYDITELAADNTGEATIALQLKTMHSIMPAITENLSIVATLIRRHISIIDRRYI